MNISEEKVEHKAFLELIEELRAGSHGKVSSEMLLRDWNPDEPVPISLLYLINTNNVAIVPVPLDTTTAKIDSFYIIKDVEMPVNYGALLKEFIETTGCFKYLKGRGVILVKKGEDAPMLPLYSGLAVHESPFLDSPCRN